MSEGEVAEDFLGWMDLEIARRQRGKMGLQLLRAQVLGSEAIDLLHELLALLLLGADELRSPDEQLHRFAVQ